ncbi:hypothetical protein [Fodinibius saliphilus]|uniref:hypothetical protein n=1 Tax=Fodinibius saliphilus TaxID=1920650 RepID=UPI00110907E0|nr:hypothetical protein [Fodinibius saliphilus]
MSESAMPTKRDLMKLRFEVISDDENINRPLCQGDYRDVVTYLKKRDVDGLNVIAVDIDSWSSMDPISAKEFLKWYELIVIPQFKEATYTKEVEIYFPSQQLELAKEV